MGDSNFPKEESAADFGTIVKDEFHSISLLSKQEIPAHDFYQQVLQGTVKMGSAHAGFIWMTSDSGTELVATVPERAVQPNPISEFDSEHLKSLGAFSGGDGIRFSTVQPTDERLKYTNVPIKNAPVEDGFTSVNYLLLQDHKTKVILELVISASQASESDRILEVLSAIKEMCEDFHRNKELRQLRSFSSVNRELLQFSKRILSVREFAGLVTEISNSAVRIFDIDRAAVLSRSHGTLRLESVSGTSSANQFADATNSIVTRAADAIASGLPSIVSGDQAQSSFSLFPVLSKEESALADPELFLFIENLDGEEFSHSHFGAIKEFCDLSAQASQNLVPKGPVKVLQKVARNRKWQIVGALIVGVCLALFLVPARLNVPATGQVYPQVERNVFAPADGEIVKIEVSHNQTVEKGDVLLRIHSPDLQEKMSGLQAEHKATLEKIHALEASQASEADFQNPHNDDRLAVSPNMKELMIMKASQLKRMAMLQEQLDKLEVRSPIKGRIVTWQLNKLLDDRPVSRGQLLMSVADTDGDWYGELEVRDYRIGNVIRASDDASSTLEVEFTFVSNPTVELDGELVSVDQNTSENVEGLPIVRVISHLDSSNRTEFRPGAKIIANIHCGTKSLGYVWFHELIDSVRKGMF